MPDGISVRKINLLLVVSKFRRLSREGSRRWRYLFNIVFFSDIQRGSKSIPILYV